MTLEARARGAIVRPLGDTIVLVPPLAISKRDLVRLVAITAGVDPRRRRRRLPAGPRPSRWRNAAAPMPVAGGERAAA